MITKSYYPKDARYSHYETNNANSSNQTDSNYESFFYGAKN